MRNPPLSYHRGDGRYYFVATLAQLPAFTLQRDAVAAAPVTSTVRFTCLASDYLLYEVVRFRLAFDDREAAPFLTDRAIEHVRNIFWEAGDPVGLMVGGASALADTCLLFCPKDREVRLLLQEAFNPSMVRARAPIP